MSLRALLAVPAVFVVWVALDFLLHAILLKETYEKSKDLWRPEDEMMMGLSFLVTFITAAIFVGIYSRFFAGRRIAVAMQYGALFGAAMGVGMGYGTYCFMPIPYELAVWWFVGAFVKFTVAGAVMGAIIEDTPLVKSGEEQTPTQ